MEPAGQQVFFAQRDPDGSASTCDYNTDAWDGYRASRQRITQGWVNRGVRNPVVLTGDVHRHWANNVKLNYFDTAAAPVGAELVASSITSGGDGADSTPGGMQYNPHLNYIGNHRGYVRVTANATQLVADFQKVSSVVTRDPASVTLSTVRKYAVEDGVPGLHQV